MSDKLDHIIESATDYFNSYEQNNQEMANAHLVALRCAVRNANLRLGEHVFCMRSNDLAAPSAIRRWYTEAEKLGSPPETLSEVMGKLEAFEKWQADPANTLLVKVPT